MVQQDKGVNGGSPDVDMGLAHSSKPTFAKQEPEPDLEISPAPSAEEIDPNKKTAQETQRLVFVRPSAEYRYNADTRRMLRNSMLFGVGFLECANAGDFAANVWNQIPSPIYALVLMGIGGMMALFLSTFAFKDARLSWYASSKAFMAMEDVNIEVGVIFNFYKPNGNTCENGRRIELKNKPWRRILMCD